MAGKSSIEWTERTWNPIVGCTVVSPGCTNCYAMQIADRFKDVYEGRKWAGVPAEAVTRRVNGKAVWTGQLALAPDHIFEEPLKRKNPSLYFVNSMGDLFHEDVPTEWIDRAFSVMGACQQHTFQILTKRAERMRAYVSDPQTPFRVSRAMDFLLAQGDLGPEKVQPIDGYPGYFASSHGHIYSEKRGRRRRMKPDAGEQGHLRVQLHREGKTGCRGDRFLVHRLILETFVGPAASSVTQGLHRDGNPGNNALPNLRWGDQAANWSDSKRHGSHRRYSKLNDTEVAEIRRRLAAGDTCSAIARDYGISDTQIRNIRDGKQWTTESSIPWPLPNCWMGVSAERQEEADERIPLLLQTPAAIRFVSCEPLLGWVRLDNIYGRLDWMPEEHNQFDALHPSLAERLNWVIAGAESGHGARDCDVEWIRSLKNQCVRSGVPFFYKQNAVKGRKIPTPELDGRKWVELPGVAA